MEGRRGYATAIAAVVLIAAGSVLGLRWHALTQRADASEPAKLSSYSPPQRDSSGGNSSGAGTAPAQNKGKGVSPSKPPSKPAPKVEAQPTRKSSAKPTLPALHSIDINTAMQAQLEALPGIGPALAGRIISHRNQHGAFSSVDALDDVKGIGPKKLADIAPYCYVE